MSAKNNVNKVGHYTQAGRDRPNTNTVHNDYKQQMTRAQKRIATGEAAAPHGEHPKVNPVEEGIVPESEEAKEQ